MIGRSIAHYEITAKLGQGGMGEVYRARDTRLNREVALKLLPEMFANDEQRMGRFSREAQVLASLNHSNIAAIHGIEESKEGQRVLVMELVEGEDLSERIARGPIPLDEALPIALQIAEALENAHEKGIIHRDLKPANIKLTPEGKVKILDFGLAKALEDPVTASGSASGLSQSPTLSMAATQAGIILGTAAYMSPEQARGKTVDRRADIWAFGVVLFEILTGKQAFSGEDLSLTMANVMTKEPDWESLIDSLPRAIRGLLDRCLKKDPRSRLRDIGDARIVIEDYLADPSEDPTVEVAPSVESVPPWRKVLPWAFAGLFCIAFLSTLWLLWPSAAAPEPPRRLGVDLGAEVTLAPGSGTGAVLSPDGSVLAFLGTDEAGEERQLYLRRMDQLEATVLPSTRNAVQPSFSPDGQWIAFRANRELKKISVSGGAAVTLCEADNSRGISWGEDGSIVFASNTRGGLSRVSAVGGAPEPLTTLSEGEITHRWPQVLPGGNAVLFTAHSSGGQFDEAQIVAQRLPDGERKVLWQGGHQGRYLPSGHLVYVNQGTLFAVPFDLGELEILGQPAPILQGVSSSSGNGSSQFAFSERGTLVYVPGHSSRTESQLEWLDTEGNRQPLPLEPADIGSFQLSPSGRFLALEINDGQQWDIWIYDIDRDTLTRLTFDQADDGSPVWSPSGKSIVFASERNGARNLYWKQADGSGEVQRLTESENAQLPFSWHPSGQHLALMENIPNQESGLRILALEGDDQLGWTGGETTTFLNTPFFELSPLFSPDGNWLAYASFETGRAEVFVRPFPGPGGKWQISSGGGVWPQWSKTGQKLFFGGPGSGEMYRVSYRVEGNSFLADRPERWTEGDFSQRGYTLSYNPHPDGQRLVLRKQAGEEAREDLDHVVLFQNFSDYLKQQIPVP